MRRWHRLRLPPTCPSPASASSPACAARSGWSTGTATTSPRASPPAMRVVDAACGEGYGSALLARTAAQRRPASTSPARPWRTRARPTPASPNLAFVQAPCTKLPLADASADLFVSFETVEHIARAGGVPRRDRARAGARRPAAPVVPQQARVQRPARVRERVPREGALPRGARRARGARASRMRAGTASGRRFFSVIAPEPHAGGRATSPRSARRGPPRPARPLGEPLYFLVAASRSRRHGRHAPGHALRARRPRRLGAPRLREGDARARHRRRARRRAGEGGRARSPGPTTRRCSSRDEALSWAGEPGEPPRPGGAHRLASSRAASSERDREIARRGGLRWWLHLPFHRLLGR